MTTIEPPDVKIYVACTSHTTVVATEVELMKPPTEIFILRTTDEIGWSDHNWYYIGYGEMGSLYEGQPERKER